MKVWSVMQIVSPNHNTSYPIGKNWVKSHDSESKAQAGAEIINNCRGSQCLGVEYVVLEHDECEAIA